MLIAVLLLFLFYEGARWAQLEMVAWLLTTLPSVFRDCVDRVVQPEIGALSAPWRNLSSGTWWVRAHASIR